MRPFDRITKPRTRSLLVLSRRDLSRCFAECWRQPGKRASATTPPGDVGDTRAAFSGGTGCTCCTTCTSLLPLRSRKIFSVGPRKRVTWRGRAPSLPAHSTYSTPARARGVLFCAPTGASSVPTGGTPSFSTTVRTVVYIY